MGSRYRRKKRMVQVLFRRIMFECLEDRLNMALDVPALSSLPGANHTIYLDFNGHVTTGTSWNSAYGVTTINSPAYSTDADRLNFSASELTTIERVWRRVAEDFAPFNVNVTTVSPASVDDLRNTGGGDAKWGIRVVITQDNALNCGCGGIAYINSFNWNSDTPVFVFNSGEVGVAEAASHEVGHSLGLSHDGTSTSSYYQGHGSGATSWAPIMGVGYSVNVSQWDRGEYLGSNNAGASANYNRGPDDLAIITTYNGFSYKADDIGNIYSNATPLTVSGSTVAGSGVISQRTDVDVFQFTTSAGNVTLNINPASLGANLDILATLRNSAGDILAESNPPDALSATMNVAVEAGTYYLSIDGTGVGSPGVSPPTGYTDYGSLGQYSISGSIGGTVSGASLGIAATNAVKAEGNSGTTAFTFTVSRTGVTSDTNTVNWSVAGSGAAPASASDFSGGLLPSGTLTFNPGDTSQTITVFVAGDTLNENNESFTVSLSGATPSGSTSISIGAAVGTIQNDDVAPTPPTLSISATDASKSEGTASSATPFLFTITRFGDANAAASVTYSVAGTGNRRASGSDFVGGFPRNVTVSFAPGVTSANVVLQVVADSVDESNESFRVTLSNAVGATIAGTTANGNILDDDGPSNIPHESLIAVADPLWMFVPESLLTATQLSVPVMTWINGVPYIGDMAHDHDLDHADDIDEVHSEFDTDVPFTSGMAYWFVSNELEQNEIVVDWSNSLEELVPGEHAMLPEEHWTTNHSDEADIDGIFGLLGSESSCQDENDAEVELILCESFDPELLGQYD